MKTIQITILPIIAAFTCFLSGCSTTKSDYKSVRNADTIQAYQGFLSRHPTGEFADSAKQRIGALQVQEQQRERELREIKKQMAQDEQRIKNNWRQLRMGMTVTEVEKLLGELKYPTWSWTMGFSGRGDMLGLVAGQKNAANVTSSTLTYIHDNFRLEFHESLLARWSSSVDHDDTTLPTDMQKRLDDSKRKSEEEMKKLFPEDKK